jgi:hypothetical protein
MKDRITYCGHEIDKDGLWKQNSKIESVLNTPRPKDVSSLRAYLGTLNYYHRFLPNLATVVKPMNELLEKNRKFDWSTKCQEAFEKSKQLITSEPVLTHYNPELPVRLASDASPYGISGILSHVMPDGSEKPIAFASRSLTKTEQKYAQVDRESLGIFWSVRKFYPYLYGRKFTLITDCQPLMSIFNPSKGIPATAAARVQRYALYLSGFNYDIEYKCTNKHTNVDGLSRLPVQICNDNCEDDAEEVFYTSQVDPLPVTSAQISRETQHERVLSHVFENVKNGWSSETPEQVYKAFYNRRNELSIHRGCLMWGIRVIIPVKFRKSVLDLLHVSHPGIVKMKALARSYVWWPGIDNDIEQLVKCCYGCQMQQKAPASVHLHPWEWPSSSWERIHVDFVGPFLGRMFLVIVDAHSKWPEIVEMKSTTAERTVQVIRSIFARNGLPKILVSDNGVQFCSDIFTKFLKDNGVCHIKTSVAKPSTNGLCERFNGTFKSSLRAMEGENADLNQKINSFLLTYRNSPHSTTGETPAKLFLGRNLRTRLDLIKPDTQGRVNESRIKQSVTDTRPMREFEVGQNVLARDYRPTSKEKWVIGNVVSRDGTLMYSIDIGHGITWRRHVDQLRKTEISRTSVELQGRDPVLPPSLYDHIHVDGTNVQSNKTPLVVTGNQDKDNEAICVKTSDMPSSNLSVDRPAPPANERRYPLRERKAPDRFTL